MLRFPFSNAASPETAQRHDSDPEQTTQATQDTEKPLNDLDHTPESTWPTRSSLTASDDQRLAKMERNEPKRRLIRDAKALCKQRRITQAQMAQEMGVPVRTLEDWLQFRRMPKAPGTTLLRRWMDTHMSSINESL